jgi:hypothetical protein
VIYDTGEGPPLYVNVEILDSALPFPEAIDNALQQARRLMLRNLSEDLKARSETAVSS